MTRIILIMVGAVLLANKAAAQCSAPYFVEQAFPVGGADRGW